MDTIKETAKNPSLIESMFKVGAHYGYSKTRRHPSFGPLLFGAKERLDIIDLEKTGTHLNRALEFIKNMAKDNRTILFVGTKPEAKRAVEEYVIPTGAPYVIHRWIGGTLTNFSEMKKRISHFTDLKSKMEKGGLEMYTKKERLLFERELLKLENNFGGVASMNERPHAIFLVDPREEKTAIREAKQVSIPIIALSGTDCNVEDIEYAIPANDSSLASIRFFVEKAVQAYVEGRALREKNENDNNDNKGQNPQA